MTYQLCLYVTGNTSRSQKAINDLKKLCTEEFQDEYELTVIDVLSQPEAADQANIIATPTVIKSLPRPILRILGDLSDKDKVLFGLNIEPSGSDGFS